MQITIKDPRPRQRNDTSLLGKLLSLPGAFAERLKLAIEFLAVTANAVGDEVANFVDEPVDTLLDFLYLGQIRHATTIRFNAGEGVYPWIFRLSGPGSQFQAKVWLVR